MLTSATRVGIIVVTSCIFPSGIFRFIYIYIYICVYVCVHISFCIMQNIAQQTNLLNYHKTEYLLDMLHITFHI